MTQALRIKAGRLFDPANNLCDHVKDLLIYQGKVVQSLPDKVAVKTIDASGNIVMPGGVEMHSHIASMSVNAARSIQSQSGYHQVVPSALDTGELYAKLGYTTAMEPAVPPAAAAASHMQLDRLPNLDAGLLLLVGNHEAVMQAIAQNDQKACTELILEMVSRCGAYGIKAVNPAAVATWRRDPKKVHIDSLDDKARDFNISPRRVLEMLAATQEDLALPHALHIHGPQLGEPGNVQITSELIKTLDGQRCHYAHLQYYCYGKTKRGGFKSDCETLLNLLRDQPQMTADLGMVAFGPAFTATADLPLEHELYRYMGNPSTPATFLESGNEDCFGVMPLIHTPKSPSHCMQWATGLELALLWDDPWKQALTIDHPNGGSFLNYPELIALLMNKPYRDQQLAACHHYATQHTGLAQITRELSLQEIVILTRASPAKILGLANKGHLGQGADGDVTIYHDQITDPKAMFTSPRYVIKAGNIIVHDQDYHPTLGKRIILPIDSTDESQTRLDQWLTQSTCLY